MRTLRIALAQINPTVGDLRGNSLAIRRWIAKAEALGADLVAFPELAMCGYPPEDLLHKPSFVDDTIAAVKRLARDVGSTAVIVGYVDRSAAGLHNAAAVLHKGRIRGIYYKVQLPNYGVFDEVRYFQPGDDYPLFALRGVHVGVSVCEDAWVGDGPVRRLAKAGAEVIININASPYHRGKGLERRVLARQRARDNDVVFAYLQTVGGQDELVFDGESLIYAGDGTLLARGAQFAEDLVALDLDFSPRPRRVAKKATVIGLGPGGGAAPRRKVSRTPLPERTRKQMEPTEEVYSALLLGTRDYARKNGFTSAIIGLSGGIDSSLTAAIAADALGARNVCGVAMPSTVSSLASIEDAKELATNMGIDFRITPIAAILAEYLQAFSDEPLPVGAVDNIQARIRGTLLMARSNATGALVLTTGNKSEMATGYATLYGDMAGGFSVLKDVPKTLVYKLAYWRNERGPAVIPERVLTKPPTAELHEGQLDTDALPPYEELDPILEAYVERDIPIDDIPGSKALVRRVARMVDVAEYKRRQAPPGVKITARAFGKDRRLPITNRYKEWAISDAAPARKASSAKRKGRR